MVGCFGFERAHWGGLCGGEGPLMQSQADGALLNNAGWTVTGAVTAGE